MTTQREKKLQYFLDLSISYSQRQDRCDVRAVCFKENNKFPGRFTNSYKCQRGLSNVSWSRLILLDRLWRHNKPDYQNQGLSVRPSVCPTDRPSVCLSSDLDFSSSFCFYAGTIFWLSVWSGSLLDERHRYFLFFLSRKLH